MPSKHVRIITDRINKIHEKKNHDYAVNNNPFSNFERSAIIAEWFNDPVHKMFAMHIGNKLSRLAELLNGKVPNNESIDDNFLDLDTYCCLFHAYYLESIPRCEAHDMPLVGQTTAGMYQNSEDLCSYCKLPFIPILPSGIVKDAQTGKKYHRGCYTDLKAPKAKSQLDIAISDEKEGNP